MRRAGGAQPRCRAVYSDGTTPKRCELYLGHYPMASHQVTIGLEGSLAWGEEQWDPVIKHAIEKWLTKHVKPKQVRDRLLKQLMESAGP